MSDYKASVMCAVFDDKYRFIDVILIGIADNEDKAKALQMDDIWRVMEDFGSGKCEIETTRSEYDEPITVVHTHEAGNDGYTKHWHYYCLFDDSVENKADSENNNDA